MCFVTQQSLLVLHPFLALLPAAKVGVVPYILPLLTCPRLPRYVDSSSRGRLLLWEQALSVVVVAPYFRLVRLPSLTALSENEFQDVFELGSRERGKTQPPCDNVPFPQVPSHGAPKSGVRKRGGSEGGKSGG